MNKIARYNKYIQFFHADEFYVDNGGNLVPKYVPYKKKWCYRKDLVGLNQEKTESGADMSKRRVRLAMRLNNHIKEDMCFFADGYIYDVVTVGDPDGLGLETVVMGEVKVDGGRN